MLHNQESLFKVMILFWFLWPSKLGRYSHYFYDWIIDYQKDSYSENSERAQQKQSLSSKFMIYEKIISVLPIYSTYCDAWFDSLTTEWVFTNFVCTTFQFFIKYQSILLPFLYVRICKSPLMMKNCPEWNVIVIQSAKQIGYLVDLKLYSVPSSRSNRLDFRSSSVQGFEIVSDLNKNTKIHIIEFRIKIDLTPKLDIIKLMPLNPFLIAT